MLDNAVIEFIEKTFGRSNPQTGQALPNPNPYGAYAAGANGAFAGPPQNYPQFFQTTTIPVPRLTDSESEVVEVEVIGPAKLLEAYDAAP